MGNACGRAYYPSGVSLCHELKIRVALWASRPMRESTHGMCVSVNVRAQTLCIPAIHRLRIPGIIVVLYMSVRLFRLCFRAF